MPPVLSSLDKVRRSQVVQQNMARRVQLAGDFIMRKLAQKRQTQGTPLVVGINGAQGSGKTTLVRGLVEFLSSRRVATVGFSLDDLYLTHAEQQQVALTHRDNPLLRFRGQPGTHDVALGRSTLLSLLANKGETKIPVYDKSLHGGYGDRVTSDLWPVAKAPVDVVLLEGWCLGFRTLDEAEFAQYLRDVKGDSPMFKYSRRYTDQNLSDINEGFRTLGAQLYDLIDAWVWMRVGDIDVVYRWRKEQEDEMAAQGKPALDDQKLEDFVARFMPAYELAMAKLDRYGFVASGKVQDSTLRLHLDADRNVVACDHQSPVL
ncbi:hypothetical protein LPJ53_001261 [Coemansia erecta]|uniref:P-loop containing nucleoside triphosphate hydrolase protein n=1 Tax=Coemansia erecta TaxID=147472 RepID=A0A9W7Y3U8_9FUNG|nr:hypothetical protein LPJ53_001261 [Coemansia erecta]